MLYAASCRPAHVRTIGLLFRSFADAEAIPRKDVDARRATHEDLALVESMHDGFFDSAAEISSYIEYGGLFIYGIPGAPAAGCGIFKRIVPGQSFVDLGMVVAQAHRRKGLGSYIVSRLKDDCIRAGYRPVCGCAIENTASIGALERAGFRCTHSLIEFAY
jgi:RimJ/RimL family protein N-acetyltransferase